MNRPGNNSNSRFTLKPSEVRRLINACQDPRERILVRLMVHCRLRREETASLRVARIDWERRRISFVGKGRLVGPIPLPADLMQDIQFYLADRQEGHLFPARKKKGAALTNFQVNLIIAAIGNRAGLKSPNPKNTTGNINSHMLRHTFARLCKDSGLGTEATQRLMRHASFKTTNDLYGTMDFESVQKLYESQFLKRV